MITIQGYIPSPHGPDQDGSNVTNPAGLSTCILPRECKSGPMSLSWAKNWQQKSANPALFPRMSPGSIPGMAADKCILKSTEYLFIPSPLCKRPRYYKLRAFKTVRFPRQVAECMTKLPENVSQEHFPFSIGIFHLFLS